MSKRKLYGIFSLASSGIIDLGPINFIEKDGRLNWQEVFTFKLFSNENCCFHVNGNKKREGFDGLWSI